MIRQPVFVDVKKIFHAVYSVMAMLVIYGAVVEWWNVPADTFFDYSIRYVAYGEVILGIFTAAAWFCVGFVGPKYRNILSNIKGFKYHAVMNVWAMYYEAWRQYTCNLGVVLAGLTVASQFLV